MVEEPTLYGTLERSCQSEQATLGQRRKPLGQWKGLPGFTRKLWSTWVREELWKREEWDSASALDCSAAFGMQFRFRCIMWSGSWHPFCFHQHLLLALSICCLMSIQNAFPSCTFENREQNACNHAFSSHACVIDACVTPLFKSMHSAAHMQAKS